MRIGFFGLGAMGQGMAANLLAAGHEVVVWNRSPGPAVALAAKGARLATTPADALKGDLALSILADDAAVLSVFDEEALGTAVPELVHANMATISLDAAKTLMERHARHGLGYVAAPVFGRADVAAAGKLNIVASGAPADLAKLAPAFEAVGQKTWEVGEDPLHAHTVKIAGNLMIATAIEMLGETLALCEKSGIDPKRFAEIMTSTVFNAPVFKGYAGLITEKRYEPAGFKMRLGLKDVSLALAAGSASQTPLPLASLIRDHFLEGIANGNGDKDWSALAEVVARKAGLN
ncbi:MAG: NAD(P)-dependent oxidoreductase [Hyphomicrobiaceae bacterium]